MIFDENFFAWIVPLGIIGIILSCGLTYMWQSSKKWTHLYKKVKNIHKYPALALLIHQIISRGREEYHTYLAKDDSEMHLYLDHELSEEEKSKIEILSSMKYIITKGWANNLLRVEFKKEKLANNITATSTEKEQ